jgi:hypothetical protein
MVGPVAANEALGPPNYTLLAGPSDCACAAATAQANRRARLLGMEQVS